MTDQDEPASPAAFQFTVEWGKVREFATATQSSHQRYQDEKAVVPATFLVSSSLWADASTKVDTGFDRKRLLHGEQEYVFHGPPPTAGQRLTAQARLRDRFERSGQRGGTMRFAVVTTEFRDESGRLVAEQNATFIETAPRTEGAR